jgi:uncharacterized phage protein (TIGR02220 family)
MAWIESHTVLARHRKTLELAFDLKVKPVQIIGHLHALWHTVLEQQEDGDLSRWSDALIAQSALWDGEPVEFVTRLRDRGWLDDSLVHDWIDYVGPYLIKKYSSGNVPRLKEIWAKHGYKYGKGQGKYAKQKATPKRVESERKESIPFPSLPNPSSPSPSEPDQREETTLSRKRDFMHDAREVLHFLNAKTGKQFRDVDTTLQIIVARLKGQGPGTEVDVQTCKSLIAKKARDWLSDESMSKYLRPETLFNRTKFESYLGELLCVAKNATAISHPTPLPAPVAGGLLRSL